MRAYLLVLLAGSMACGSVEGGTPDASSGDDASGTDASSLAPGEVVWVRSMSAAFALGLAAGPGGLIFTGSITAPTDLGGGVVTPLGATDTVIGDFALADAAFVYQARHNDASGGSVFGFLQQVDSLGNPLVYGLSFGDVDLGTGHVTSGGGGNQFADGFIGRYGPGTPAWVNRIVGPTEDKIVATANAPAGEVYAAGWFEQTTTWNGGNLISNGGRDLFLAKMNTFTGVVDLTRTYGGTGRDEISGAIGDGTNLVLAGMFDDTLALGGPVQPITATGGGLDVWVAKLDATATPVWASHFGGTGEDRNAQLAMDAAGDIYMTGVFQNQVAFGAVNLIAMGAHDVFVVKLHGSDGSVAWALQLGTTGDDNTGPMVVDKAGHPVVSSVLNGDASIASFDPEHGSIRWQKMIATSGTESVFGLSVGGTGEIFAAINLGGTFDFGKPLIGPAAPTSVVARFAP